MRRSLAQRLPDYAVPSRVVLLAEMPLNRNGKIDRSALASRCGRDRPAGLSSVHQPPCTEFEQLVAETWELLLDLDGVGVDDDFFELGGNSLIATAIVSELTDVLGIQLRARHLYEHSTVAELAGLLAALHEAQLATGARMTAAATGPLS